MPRDVIPQDLVEQKADPFSLEDVIAWLRTKDASEFWEHGGPRVCIMAQYYRDRVPGATACGYFYNEWVDARGHVHSTSFDQDMLCRVLTQPYNFGAALTRALALQAEGRER